MVTPMTKYTFLVLHNKVQSFLARVGELGVVDLTVADGEYNEEQREKLALINDYKTLTEKIKIFGAESADYVAELEQKGGITPLSTAGKALKFYHERSEKREKLLAEHSKIEGEMREVFRWGLFDSQQIDQLSKCGVDIYFYTIAEKLYNPEWSTKYAIQQVENDGNTISFVLVAVAGSIIPELEGAIAVKKPMRNFLELKGDLDNNEKLQNDVRTDFTRILSSTPIVEKEILALEYELKESVVQSSNKRVAEDKIYLIEGWVPQGVEESIDSEFATCQSVVIVKAKPTLDDAPPVLLKNNSFARVCEMITKLYSMPSYHELDLTPLFAPFFVFFVGMCFGDLGYAIVMFAGALAAWFIVKDRSIRPVLSLVMWCSFAAMIVGSLTGTFFGMALGDTELFKDIKFLGQMDMFSFALMIGLFQIIYAMFVKAYARIKYQGFKYAISTLSWAFTIITVCLTLVLPDMGINFELGSPLFTAITSALLLLNVLFFDVSKKNLLINFGAGSWELYNNITGLMGDVLSYIRLFAIGLSSGIIGSVFNDLAVGMSGDTPVLKYVIMALILLAGHGINLFMSIISSFVHPLRLTFVEFYKNAGFEGGGREYNPFKKANSVRGK